MSHCWSRWDQLTCSFKLLLWNDTLFFAFHLQSDLFFSVTTPAIAYWADVIGKRNYCSEILLLVLHLSRFQQEHILPNFCEAAKKCAALPWSDHVCRWEYRHFRRSQVIFPMGTREPKRVKEKPWKKPPRGGTADRLDFETIWLLAFFRAN